MLWYFCSDQLIPDPWIPGPLSVEIGFRILIVFEILDSLSCIPDSEAQEPDSHQEKFLRFPEFGSPVRESEFRKSEKQGAKLKFRLSRLPPMWPGFDSRTRRHMWVEFVVGSLLCSEKFFSGYSGFPISAKTTISKFQFDPECSSV